MDYKATILLAIVLTVLVVNIEGRKKKVVIHVPYKIKKIKHTHTVFKTIHHHHTHHDHELGMAPTEEHEHFHHMHIHEEVPIGAHGSPMTGVGIPEFLPDLPGDVLDVPPNEITRIPNRHVIPLYRRN